MIWQGWLTLFTIVVMLVLLFVELYRPFITVLTAMTLLFAAGIIDSKEAAAGFSNEGLLTVALLFPVAASLGRTGVLDFFAARLLGKSKNIRIQLLKICCTCAVFSVFLNNTPIVALFIPVIKTWSRSVNLAPSKFLLPMSYATAIGGICSLIGTRTNLVVNDFLLKSGEEGFGFFELGYVGFPLAFLVVTFLVIFSPWLLPDNQGGMFRFAREHAREFLAGRCVSEKFRNVGMRVKDFLHKNQLDQHGLSVVSITRLDSSKVAMANNTKTETPTAVKKSATYSEIESQIIAIQSTQSLVSTNSDDVPAAANTTVTVNQEQIAAAVAERASFELELANASMVHRRKPAIDTQQYQRVEISSNSSAVSLHSNNTSNGSSSSSSLILDITDATPIATAAPTKNKSVSDHQISSAVTQQPMSISRSVSMELMTTIAPVTDETTIEVGDYIVFSGNSSSHLALNQIQGLDPEDVNIADMLAGTELFEVVLSARSPCVGSTISESNFQERYAAAIMAVRQQSSGESLTDNKRLSKIRLNAGDTILILAKPTFYENYQNSPDFYVISRLDNPNNTNKKPDIKLFNKWHIWWWKYGAVVVFLAMVSVAASGVFSMFSCALVACVACILLQYITPKEAVEAIDWPILILIGASYGIGSAIVSSTLSQEFAMLVSGVRLPPFLMIGLIYFCTVCITELITNNACAAIMFPLVLSLSREMNLSIRPFAVVVAIGSSTCFALPIGYQANMMVQGPGGYKFRDYPKIGVPLDILVILTAVPLIYFIFPMENTAA